MGFIVIIIFGLILFGVACFGIGFAVCDEKPAGWIGVIAAALGVIILAVCFEYLNEIKQTDVSRCITDNTETIEEIKTNGEIVEYRITLKDGTKFTVKPIDEDE